MTSLNRGGQHRRINGQHRRNLHKVASYFLEGKWVTLLSDAQNEVEKAKQNPNFTGLKAYLSVLQKDFLI
jgi:hypothetical protein